MKLLVEMTEQEFDLYRKMSNTISTPLAINQPTELAAALIESMKANGGHVDQRQGVSTDFSFDVKHITSGIIHVPTEKIKISITVERGN